MSIFSCFNIFKSKNTQKHSPFCPICLNSLNELIDLDVQLISLFCGHLICFNCLQLVKSLF
jgi:hypothetical protein